MTIIYKDFLYRAGLTSDQALIYEIFMKNGIMPARKMSLISGLKRPFCYKVIDQLLAFGLIEKIDKKVALFTPTHPSRLADLISKKQESLDIAKQSINSVLGNLVSDYNLYSGKPNVRFFEGIAGVEAVYDDILLEKKNILLFRSPFDSDQPALEKLVMKQIEKQVEAGIHTKAITPLVEDSIKTAIALDEKKLVTRCLVPKDLFMIPAQVIVYGDKVAITSYKDFFVTSIIQNPDIAETFSIMFNFIWNQTVQESQKLLKKDSANMN